MPNHISWTGFWPDRRQQSREYYSFFHRNSTPLVYRRVPPPGPLALRARRTAFSCLPKDLQENRITKESGRNSFRDLKEKQDKSHCKTANRQVNRAFSSNVENNTWGTGSTYCFIATFSMPLTSNFFPELAGRPHNFNPVKLQMKTTAGEHTRLNTVFAYILQQFWKAATTFLFISVWCHPSLIGMKPTYISRQLPHSFSLGSTTAFTYIGSAYYATLKRIQN